MKKIIILICILLAAILTILGIVYDKNKKAIAFGNDIDNSNYNTYAISNYKEDSYYTYDDETLKNVTFSIPKSVYLKEITQNGILYGDNNLFITTIEDNPEIVDDYIKDMYESSKSDYSEYYVSEIKSNKNRGFLVKQIQEGNYYEQLYVFVNMGSCYAIINYRLFNNKFDQPSIDYLISHAKEESVTSVNSCNNNKCIFDLSKLEIKENNITIELPKNSEYKYSTNNKNKYIMKLYTDKNSNELALNLYYSHDTVISEENANGFIPSEYEKTEININNKNYVRLKYSYDNTYTFYDYYYRISDNMLYSISIKTSDKNINADKLAEKFTNIKIS